MVARLEGDRGYAELCLDSSGMLWLSEFGVRVTCGFKCTFPGISTPIKAASLPVRHSPSCRAERGTGYF